MSDSTKPIDAPVDPNANAGTSGTTTTTTSLSATPDPNAATELKVTAQITTPAAAPATAVAAADAGTKQTTAGLDMTDSDGDGIPDAIASYKKVLENSQFTSDWTNRRRIIFGTLYFIGAMSAFLMASVIGAMFYGMYSKTTIDANIANLLTSMIYAFSFMAVSIIGAYCFGVAYDTQNFRNSSVNLLQSITGKK